MKKILVSSVACFLLLANAITPAIAAGKADPSATGTIGWVNTGNDAQATDSFDAHQLSTCSLVWDVSGTYTLTAMYQNNPYAYTVTFTQSGNTISGTLFDPYLPGTLTVINGTISGNDVSFAVDYGNGSSQGVRTFIGTIASGVLSGNWSETGQEDGADTWSTTSGNATQAGAGCNGKGTFTYSDTSGIFYTMNVKYVNVDTTNHAAWFAGPTVSGNFGLGAWIFIKVVDNGQPGIGHDQIWGEGGDMTGAQAQSKVASMATPLGGPFTINDGNLVVHN